MEFNRCSRCGNFYAAHGHVCSACSGRDNLEFTTFKEYIEENGMPENLETISTEIGVTVKNLNRFMGYEDFRSL